MIRYQDIDTSKVTDGQVGKCHKAFNGRIPFYQVESESDSLVEYTVTYDAKGFHCTCEAGMHGFSNCKAGFCKHVLWSVAAGREEKAAVAVLNAAIEMQTVQSSAPVVDAACLKRIEAANKRQAGEVKKSSANSAYQAKGFSLLR